MFTVFATTYLFIYLPIFYWSTRTTSQDYGQIIISPTPTTYSPFNIATFMKCPGSLPSGSFYTIKRRRGRIILLGFFENPCLDLGSSTVVCFSLSRESFLSVDPFRWVSVLTAGVVCHHSLSRDLCTFNSLEYRSVLGSFHWRCLETTYTDTYTTTRTKDT